MEIFKKIKPDLYALLIFIILGLAYFPKVFQGKVLSQGDGTSWVAANKEISDYEKSTGKIAYWTNSMFSGMPATTISIKNEGNILRKAENIRKIFPYPATDLIIAMMGFYLLMSVLGMSFWLKLMSSIAFAFCAYNFQIIMVGHATKMMAISFIPYVFASVVYAYKKNKLLGSVFFGISFMLELLSNHPQITYYLGIAIFFYILSEFYIAYKSNLLTNFLKVSALVVFMGLLALGSTASKMLPLWEYTKYTMRGGSEIKDNNQKKKGLELDYATQWSYGIDETLNLLIPNFKGGASSSELRENSETYKFLAQNAGESKAKSIISNMPTYWGEQAFTAGPMYMGAISIFFFVLALFVITGPAKWWVVAVSVLALLLGWGHNMMWMSSFFYNYIPFYSKFRVPSMIFVLFQLLIPLFGFYGLGKILNKEIDKAKILAGFKYSVLIVGGLCAIFLILPGIAGSFISPSDASFPEWLRNTIVQDRESLLRMDALRSLIYVLLGAGIAWFAYSGKLKMKRAMPILALLIIFDLWGVGKRYLNDSHFMSKTTYDSGFQKRKVDVDILKDESLDYRVIDLTVNTFNDSHPSYYHKNIGGYSPAKLQRYQDIIDYYIAPEISTLGVALKASDGNPDNLRKVLPSLQILNMLNTKYFILSDTYALKNTNNFGNAWFTDDYVCVSDPKEEITSLGEYNIKDISIIGNDFKHILEGKEFKHDPNRSIKLLDYSVNKLVYKTSTSSEQLAVFSEIYYPDGWKARIDGKELPLFRANYILRCAIIPAGNHKLVMTFEPQINKIGYNISLICSIILLLLLLSSLYISIRGCFKKKS